MKKCRRNWLDPGGNNHVREACTVRRGGGGRNTIASKWRCSSSIPDELLLACSLFSPFKYALADNAVTRRGPLLPCLMKSVMARCRPVGLVARLLVPFVRNPSDPQFFETGAHQFTTLAPKAAAVRSRSLFDIFLQQHLHGRRDMTMVSRCFNETC